MLYFISCYGLTSILVFLKYLRRFFQDSTVSRSDRGSWVVLIIASLLWPICLPLSALERHVKKNKVSYSYSESQVNLIHLESETTQDLSTPSDQNIA